MVHYGSTIRCWYVLIHTNINQLISNIQRSQKWMRHDFTLEARLSCSGRRATWWPRCFKRWDLTEILDDFGIILSLSSTRPDRFAGRPAPRSQRSILKAIENQSASWVILALYWWIWIGFGILQNSLWTNPSAWLQSNSWQVRSSTRCAESAAQEMFWSVDVLVIEETKESSRWANIKHLL